MSDGTCKIDHRSELKRARDAIKTLLNAVHYTGGNAPGHDHLETGIWDKSNHPSKSGKPCRICAAWKELSKCVSDEIKTVA